ncbi:DUF4232 domain-containing protein [Micromonospora sp. NPDC000089]|uniref:DUF4232 domain-containing protein n=1 Tax=unclassified Micromonospora TaxID=2617518 RepID=UPI003688BDDD
MTVRTDLPRTFAPTARRLLALAVPSVLVVTGAVACSATDQPGSTPSASAVAQPVTTGAPEPTASASAPTSSPSAMSDACSPDQIQASLSLQPPRDGDTRTARAMLVLTNASHSPCRIKGWADLALTNARGDRVPLNATRVDQPGPTTPTALAAGASAFAGVKWTTCDKNSCPAGNTILVTVPGGTKATPARLTGFPAPEKSGITMTSVQIGTIQPSNQGVVAW